MTIRGKCISVYQSGDRALTEESFDTKDAIFSVIKRNISELWFYGIFLSRSTILKARLCLSRCNNRRNSSAINSFSYLTVCFSLPCVRKISIPKNRRASVNMSILLVKGFVHSHWRWLGRWLPLKWKSIAKMHLQLHKNCNFPREKSLCEGERATRRLFCTHKFMSQSSSVIRSRSALLTAEKASACILNIL